MTTENKIITVVGILLMIAMVTGVGMGYALQGENMQINHIEYIENTNPNIICSAGVGDVKFRTYTNESWPEYWYVTDNDYYFESAENFDIGDPIEIFYYCNNPKHLTSIHYQY